MKRRRSLLLLMLCIPFFEILAQGEVPVDMFTGSPGIHIPLWTIQDHELSVPIGVSYNASGLKLDEVARFIGVGWSIMGSGSVTREVRGLPDDFNGISEALSISGSDTVNYDDRRGWLHKKVGQTIVLAKDVGDFLPSSDNSTSTCTDESADYAKLTGYAGYADTEPDLYHFNAPGLSGSFVFDNSASPKIRLLSLQDMKVTWSKNLLTKDIVSFTITTPGGVVYNFAAATIEEEVNSPTSGSVVEFLKNEYSLYNQTIQQSYTTTQYSGNVKFYRQWMLSSIESPSGAKITFTYVPREFEISHPVKAGIRKPDDSGFDVKTVFTRVVKTYHEILSSVTSSTGERVEFFFPPDFTHSNNIVTSVRVLDSRRSDSFVKEFLFTHKYIGSSYKRAFLESIQERSYCDATPPYKFSYIGVDLAAESSALPPPDSYAKDFWGYYNAKTNTSLFPTLYVYPSIDYPDKVRIDRIQGFAGQEIILPGADRTSDALAIKIGSLNFVQYPWGGTLAIEYEPHTYLDPYSNQNYAGGGLRIKSLNYHDGMNAGSDIYKVFTYEESTGVSSGRLLMKPVFYLPAQKYVSLNGATTLTYETLSGMTAYDLWNRLLVRTEDNLAPEDLVTGSPVVYKTVNVSRPGAGSVKHVFNLPAPFSAAATGEWSPTVEKFARGTSCQTMGIMSVNGAWRYPFVRNPNYHMERGLLLNKYEYNEAGQTVRETANTYQYLYKSGSAPAKVWGLTFEHYANGTGGYLFGKYFLLTESAKVLSTETVSVYRPDNSALVTTTEYLYESSYHKYLTKTRVTNSDGTIYSTKIKYPLDYPAVSGTADMPSQMIGYMQTNSWSNIPIEIVRTIQKPAQSEKVLSASLTKFNSFTAGKPLLHQSLSLSIAEPVSDFTASQVQAGSTTTFTHDARYEITREVKSYDLTYLQPVSVEAPVSRSLASSALGYTKSFPVAQFVEATLPQVAFSDFETTTDVDFQKSALIYGDGHTGKNAIHGSVKLSRTISKAATATYILSFWAKTDSNPLTVNITFKNTSLTVLSTATIPVSATAGKFKYMESRLNVSSLPADFIIEVQGQVTGGPFTSSPGLVPVLDDVAFYPDHAQLASFTYDVPYGITSATDAAGKTVYTTFDHLGRKKYEYDQDKNIRQRNTYSFSTMPDNLTAEFTLPPVMNYTYAYLLNQPAKFVAWEDCHDNVTYEWDFGNGFVTGAREQTYTFTQYGTYPVKLRVSGASLPTVTVTQNISLQFPFTICAKGLKEYNPVTNQVLDTYSCAEITTTPLSMQTVFRVEGPEDLGSWTYSWKIRDIGSDTWKTYSPLNVVQISPSAASRSSGYEVMCEAQTGNGTAQSNVMQVIFTN